MGVCVLIVKLILIYALFNAVFACCWSTMHLGLQVQGNETDRLSLLAIKAQINQDPHNAMSTWNESIHFCLWHGVTCGRRHSQRVTNLDLQSLKLAGSLSPHIGNLSFLREIWLQNNSFSHIIPPEIGQLHRLQVLRLDNNSFTGPIPNNLSYCFNLIVMNLGFNSLASKIPTEIGSLSKLQTLSLHLNNLTGEIPHSLGNLSSLEHLSLTGNSMVGNIRSSLGQLIKLKYLGLAMNKLSGTIPPSIYNLSTLVAFSISFNRIKGSIPSDLGKNLPNLELFEIAHTNFTGSIPLSISNATSLRVFQVGANQLTGQMPNLQKLHNLFKFNVQLNLLGTGKDGELSFLSHLTNATGLRGLYLNNNNFGGKLPTTISNLSTKLEDFWFQSNKLHGSIPAGIGNLVNLESLILSSNSFTGNIPTEIGKLSRLCELYLENNKFSGNIPYSVGNLSKLTVMWSRENNLQGSIPTSLEKCRSLQLLDLSNNNLNGAIPLTLFNLPSLSIFLGLSSNHFTGSLPMEVEKLTSLGGLYVSDNMLSGEIPSTLGSCGSLEVLSLERNFFHGTIPSSMSSLKGIEELDLSHNKLSGEIPKFLEDFVFLNYLNLSFNDFSGAVPGGGVFRNASAFSIVGNSMLCISTTTTVANPKLPKCKSKEFKKGGLSHSLKLVIPLVLGLALLGVAMVFILVLCSSRNKRKEICFNNIANSVLQVSYATLLKATDEFSSTNLIGAGSFGSVYLGVLDDDDGRVQFVAVKVFNLLRHGASRSFLSECDALRTIRHRNLVKIITSCSSVDFCGNDFKALIYEYMEKGSLEEWLHPATENEETREATKSFNLFKRLDIAIDVACALDYLHNHCENPIVHCDLKPSNVLLDNELTGHVSDFGIARFLSQPTSINVSTNEISSIAVRGTVGYAAPEYGMGSEASTNGDVYSFGVLLLEMFTGKRPTDNMFIDGLNLHNFVKMALPDRVTQIADSTLFQGGTNETTNQSRVRVQKIEVCLSSIFGIGIACSIESPTDRLHNIHDAASELHSIRDILLR